ncbi:MAG: amino acid aminotransferase [Burkholderiales bacterium]
MNAPLSPSLLSGIAMAPRDPILGLTEAFNTDRNPKKINLGVGVYYDEDSKVPLLECVRRAERLLLDRAAPRGYLPIDGLPAYDRAVRDLVFGADSAAVKEGRIVTVQALGGTGGLKVGADFLRSAAPRAGVWISDPSWENHRGLFENAGFTVQTYPYYDAKTHGLNSEGTLAALRAMPAGSIVVLHACCHNPTGIDFTPGQWTAVIDAVLSRGLTPFLDFAYQGFGEGIEADSAAVRRFVETGVPVFVSSSFSKSLSLYGERVGSLSVVAQDGEEAARVLSQLKRLVRTNYSNPPIHGGQVAAIVLTTPELRALWERELGDMRERIKEMRRQLVDQLRERAPRADFRFVLRQRGMFSYSGLTREQVVRLREEFAVYMIESGRICVAALNAKNIGYAADCIARVIA